MRTRSIINSALWSAYGDALGFITELADLSAIKRRTGLAEVKNTIEWRRRIGGRFGADVILPAGTYSDDTQLRLATSRCIRGDGRFDVEAFAKVELPVWQYYALGAGKASKRAANNLSKETVNWFSNFFDQKEACYFNAGGNGAAMRIQPHIWSASEESNEDKLFLDIIRNCISTHGHPRGILGALFHALALRATMFLGRQLRLETLFDIAHWLKKVPSLLTQDEDISRLWLPSWETKTRQSFVDSWEHHSSEFITQISSLSFSGRTQEEMYQKAIEALDATSPATRGSATITGLLASFAAFLFANDGPESALRLIVNKLGTDTDSIATMAGALLGLFENSPPKSPLQDKDYISLEATRLEHIALGELESSFDYPDLLSWRPPKSIRETLYIERNSLFIHGLGKVATVNSLNASKDEAWQKVELDFGQSLLIRKDVKISTVSLEKVKVAEIFGNEPLLSTADESDWEEPLSIDDLSNKAIQSNFSPEIIGKHILMLSEDARGIEKAIAYVSIVTKARITRLRKNS